MLEAADNLIPLGMLCASMHGIQHLAPTAQPALIVQNAYFNVVSCRPRFITDAVASAASTVSLAQVGNGKVGCSRWQASRKHFAEYGGYRSHVHHGCQHPAIDTTTDTGRRRICNG